MEWLSSLRKTVDYLEQNLLIDCEVSVAANVGVSAVYLNRGFEIITGFTISSYVKRRRLYLAGVDIIKGQSVIDTAFKYGYSTPESFTKAFVRFHGITPVKLKKSPDFLKVFLPITFSIAINGGENMDVRFEELEAMELIGFTRVMTFDKAYECIPLFWQEKSSQILSKCWKIKDPDQRLLSELEKTVVANSIGMFGASFDCQGDHFKYGILGPYKGGISNDLLDHELEVLTLPKGLYAKFVSTGPLPESIQAVNKEIFTKWLPGNPDYELTKGPVLEYYPNEDCQSQNYKCEIWVPVIRKS